MSQSQLDEPSQLFLRDLLACRVHGGVVGRCGGVAKVVRLDGKPMPVRPSTKAHTGPRKQLGLQPRLVEPRCSDLACAVRNQRGEDVEAPSAAARGLADDALQHGTGEIRATWF